MRHGRSGAYFVLGRYVWLVGASLFFSVLACDGGGVSEVSHRFDAEDVRDATDGDSLPDNEDVPEGGPVSIPRDVWPPDETETRDVADSEGVRTCDRAADCLPGQGCVDGVCAPCGSADHCAPGFGCRVATGACDTCRVAQECRAGQGCVGGVCGPCGAGPDCDGLLCREGRCEACSGSAADAACATQYGDDEYACGDDGVCAPATCTDGTDCRSTRRVCGADGRCVPCEDTHDCIAERSGGYASETSCIGGVCLEVDCETSARCPVDRPVCGEEARCRGCYEDAECLPREEAVVSLVCDITTGRCPPGDCYPRAGACGEHDAKICGDDFFCRGCAEDAECRDALSSDDAICEGGLCAAGCETNGDCPDNGICQQSRCRPCANDPAAAADDCQANGYGDGILCVDGACVTATCNEVVPCADERVCWAQECVDCTPEDIAYCTLHGQVCDVDARVCVECLNDAHCTGGARICDGRACRGCLPGECGDGRVCADGACTAGDCWIDGQILNDRDTAAGEPCARCDPDRSRLAWSPNGGVDCDDQQACTSLDRCSVEVAGLCQGVAYTCAGNECADGVCHGTGPGDCTLAEKPSWDGCFVDGGCYAHNAENPSNVCQVCDGGTGAWVVKPEGTRCGDCRTCQGGETTTRCDFVPEGDDPHNDCTDNCQVCDGWGGCQWAAAETDPNDDCSSEPEVGCGRNGLCAGGSDRCAFWTEVEGIDDGNECTTGDRCDGAGGTASEPVADGTPCAADTKVCRAGDCADCLPGECPAGRVCGDGSCLPGDCHPAGVACGADGAWVCGDDYVCRVCTGDGECRASLTSDAAVCDAGGCLVGCAVNGDCPNHGVCEGNRCRLCANEGGVVVDDCQAHGYGAGVLCVAGACVGATCNDVVVCADARVCLAGACVDCTAENDTYCTTRGRVCNPAPHVCVECVVSDDCAGGARICASHACRDCWTDAECGADRVCLANGRCVPGDCRDAATDCAPDPATGGRPTCEEHWCAPCPRDEVCKTYGPFWYCDQGTGG